MYTLLNLLVGCQRIVYNTLDGYISFDKLLSGASV